jgi:hypothetical protein
LIFDTSFWYKSFAKRGILRCATGLSAGFRFCDWTIVQQNNRVAVNSDFIDSVLVVNGFMRCF